MAARTLHAAGITGVGMDFPERRLTNEELEKMVETSDAWIRERTGIRERRIAEPGVGASHHGVAAARAALAQAGLAPEDVDLIIVPTVTPDMVFPATACLIQDALGATRAWGYDLSAACSGFVFALQAARAQVESGCARRTLVIGTEIMSSILDWEDRNTCILFGDGAGAVVVERLEPGSEGILDAAGWIDGSGAQLLYMPAGGSRLPASHETVERKQHVVYQDGREVFKHAVRGMTKVTASIIERNGFEPSDVALFVAHQANLRIIEAVQKRLSLTDEQTMITIDRFGNTTSASIPTSLGVAQEEGRLHAGDLVVLCSFGAGFTCGATLLRWTAP
jgi:3-oxoacyl-[acyl-carrier-protein] synthase-3